MTRYLWGIGWVVTLSLLLSWLITAYGHLITESNDLGELQAVPLGFVGVGSTLVLVGLLETDKGDQAADSPVKELAEVGNVFIAVGGLSVAILQFREKVGVGWRLLIALLIFAAGVGITYILKWIRG